MRGGTRLDARMLLGISGALTYFAPLQPLLGNASVGFLGYALWLRLGPGRPATAAPA